MKNIIKIVGLFVFATLLFSCNDDEAVAYQTGLTQQITDPYLQVTTGVVSFQAGTPSYNMRFNVLNGTKALSKVDIYHFYTDNATGKVSNEVLYKSFPVSGALTKIDDEFTYDELKAGLMIDGAGLPEDQTALAIGSGWRMRFEGTVTDGSVIPMSGSIFVGVLSRFAGLYKVIESGYWRIGVDNGGWNGGERFIGSVDETTYSYNDFWGNFGWGGNAFHFRLDETDNSITVPILVNGALFSGNRAINCTDDAAIFVNAPCAGSNVLIPDDANGKHVIKLTYGYFTDGSGPREFYEVLEKIVN
jgi:hypothetical protein